MRRYSLLILLVVFTLSACRKSNDVTSPLSGGRAANPFSGSMSYSVAAGDLLPCDCSGTIDLGNFEGAGTLSHLGNSTSRIHPCILPLFGGDGSVIGSHVTAECAYFKAANGDELYCHTRPYDLYDGPTGSIGTVTVDFVGGTGRFAGATGSFTGIVTVHMTGTATLTGISGTISY